MALTRSFKDLVQARATANPAFATTLLHEAVDQLLAGDLETGKIILRDYIKATIGWENLAEATGAPAKSLIRMFGPKGNPQARNLLTVLHHLQRQAGIELHVAPTQT